MTRPPQTLVDDLVAIRQWSQRAPPTEIPEVDTINVMLGDGSSVLVPGVGAALRVDFRARITGCFVQEIDGITGSIVMTIERAQGGATPTWVSIVDVTPPTISSGRYVADQVLEDWTVDIARGDYLRFGVFSATAFTRIALALRIRRLEP